MPQNWLSIEKNADEADNIGIDILRISGKIVKLIEIVIV